MYAIFYQKRIRIVKCRQPCYDGEWKAGEHKMKNRVNLWRQGADTRLCIKKESFTVGGTRLLVEDHIPLLAPWNSERILWIKGTNCYYSVVPLFPLRHRLLCFTFCEDELKLQKPDLFNRALVLGCGGGAVPRWILETYPKVSIDVVDFSPEIIRICQKYFVKRWQHSDRLTFYCQDAGEYEAPDNSYQFIFCDLFDGETLAPVVCQPDFARKLCRMAGEGGILIINCGWHQLRKVQSVYSAWFTHLQVVPRDPWQTEVLLLGNHPLKS